MTRRSPRRSTCKWPPFSPQRTLELADAGCADWGRRRSADTGRRAGHPRSANDDDAPPHPRAEALAQPVRRAASAAQEGPCGFGPPSQDPASAGLRDSTRSRGAGSLQRAFHAAENSAAVHHGAWLDRRRAPVAVTGRPRLLNGSDDLQVDPPGRQAHSLGHAAKTPTRQFDNAHITPGSSPKSPAISPADRTTSMGDRKSTRLNSSHITISYAVFCLKKKNI